MPTKRRFLHRSAVLFQRANVSCSTISKSFQKSLRARKGKRKSRRHDRGGDTIYAPLEHFLRRSTFFFPFLTRETNPVDRFTGALIPRDSSHPWWCRVTVADFFPSSFFFFPPLFFFTTRGSRGSPTLGPLTRVYTAKPILIERNNAHARVTIEARIRKRGRTQKASAREHEHSRGVEIESQGLATPELHAALGRDWLKGRKFAYYK